MSTAVKVRLLNPMATLPVYASPGAAGADLHACIEHPVTIDVGEKYKMPTGVAVELPPGFEIQVRPRSGLACVHGLTIANSPGTIDADYRGEIFATLINLGKVPYTVAPGERVAQMVLARFEKGDWTPADALSETGRGAGGFGSTGR